MNTPGKEHLDKLARALAQAHAAQEVPQFSTGWRTAVMRDIRREASARTAIEVPQLVWRAAVVVVLVSLALVGSLLSWDAGRADADFSALFAEATVSPTILTGAR